MFKDESAAMQFTIGSFFPLLCLSGILWPLEGTPHWLKEAAQFLPTTASVQAMRDVMSRGNQIHNSFHLSTYLYASLSFCGCPSPVLLQFLIKQSISSQHFEQPNDSEVVHSSCVTLLSPGWTLTYPSVYYGLISSVSWFLIYIALTWIFLKIKKW